MLASVVRISAEKSIEMKMQYKTLMCTYIRYETHSTVNSLQFQNKKSFDKTWKWRSAQKYLFYHLF